MSTPLNAAARALCFGHCGDNCDACTEPSAEQCARWPMFVGDTTATVMAYLRATGRDAEANSLMPDAEFVSGE